jgi:hypothetical protein
LRGDHDLHTHRIAPARHGTARHGTAIITLPVIHATACSTAVQAAQLIATEGPRHPIKTTEERDRRKAEITRSRKKRIAHHVGYRLNFQVFAVSSAPLARTSTMRCRLFFRIGTLAESTALSPLPQ